MIENFPSALFQPVFSVFGKTIEYSGVRNGKSFAIYFPAVASEGYLQRQNQYGEFLNVSVRTFLISADSLADAGNGQEQIVPQRGDKITETVNGRSAVFEVLPDKDAPCWEWADTMTRTHFRVYTKEETA